MTSLRLKRGTTAQINSYTGPPGELIVDTTSNQLRLHNGTTVGGVTVGSLTMTPIKTSVYTANANELVRINSAAGGFTITLPASPSDGTKISFIDVVNQCGTNPVLVAANGKTILGDSTGISLDVNGAGLSLMFNELTNNWSKLDMFSSSFAVVDTAQNITYVDDVFSAYTYTGNGSTQTINNGINLSGKGGMVWIKDRTSNTFSHILQDTVNGNTKKLNSNTPDALSNDSNAIQTFNNNGFSLGVSAGCNYNNDNFVSWTFRKAPKFFDVVTYTGDGVAYRVIAHNLGIDPGMVIIKRTDNVSDWYTMNRRGTNAYACGLFLNTTNAQQGSTHGISPGSYATSIAIENVPNGGGSYSQATAISMINASGATYVAYLFAHDPSADGMIQCGSFATDGSGNATVTLGWEPQFILWKPSSSAGDWQMLDSSRNLSITSQLALKANLSNAEAAYAASTVQINATGFTFTWAALASTTCIYLAIRRPNKPPTVGTQVYNAIARTGTGANATITGVGFAPDLSVISRRNSTNYNMFTSRLTGPATGMFIPYTQAENTATYADTVTSFGIDGIGLGVDGGAICNANTATYISHFFKRAPGVFEEVAYTATGTSALTINHSLWATPELAIFKMRSTTSDWYTFHIPNNFNRMFLNLTNSGQGNAGGIASVSPTTIVLTANDVCNVTAGTTYIAYLFATKAGISKVGSYTGNGTNQTINCGFTTGARFILIKRTDSTGDWYVWDSVRGIVSGNDPHLSLNSTAAEVTTDDSIDPDNSGFIVNQVSATNINVNAGTYIFLAFA